MLLPAPRRLGRAASSSHEVTIPGFDEPYLYIRDVAGLVAMVQMGVLEIHPWGVTVERARPRRPDRSSTSIRPRGSASRRWSRRRRRCASGSTALGLASFVKTTGGKGLHVVVPIEATAPMAGGEELRQGRLGRDGRRLAGPLSDHGRQGRAGRADLHRLSAQRPDLDRGRALFDPLAPGRAGGDAARVGAGEGGARSVRLYGARRCRR